MTDPNGGVSPRVPSATDCLGQAWNTMSWVCFQNFSFGRWFILGFAVFLAQCGQGGGGSSFNFPTGGGGGPGTSINYGDIQAFLDQYLGWVLAGAAALWLVVAGLVALTTYISSHGCFVLLSNIARNEAEIRAPWAQYSGLAMSLFKLRLIIWGVGFVLFTLLVLLVGMTLYGGIQNESLMDTVPYLLGFGLVAAPFMLAFTLISFFINNFVFPIMFAKGSSSGAAWTDGVGLLKAHTGTCVLYLFMRLVMVIATGVVAVLIGCVVGLVLCCLMIIPGLGTYIITVATLPVWVFMFAMPAHFIQSFGPEYTIFPEYLMIGGGPDGGGYDGGGGDPYGGGGHYPQHYGQPQGDAWNQAGAPPSPPPAVPPPSVPPPPPGDGSGNFPGGPPPERQ